MRKGYSLQIEEKQIKQTVKFKSHLWKDGRLDSEVVKTTITR